MGNAKETDCHSPLRGFAMTDTENANLRGMERFFAYAQNDRLGYAFPPFVILRPKGEESFSARFIGDRICVSSSKHFNRSAGRSASCAAADARKKTIPARRGVDRKAGRFFSPRLRVLLWSFLLTREESGVPIIKERTIKNPANPQICRRWEMQERRIATGVSRPRNDGYRRCEYARKKTSSGFASLNHLSRLRTRSRRGSDMPLACHSLPRRCLRHPRGEGKKFPQNSILTSNTYRRNRRPARSIRRPRSSRGPGPAP